MLRKVLLAAVATAMLSACGGGETYALPEKQVRSKLMSLRPPMFVFGSGGVSAMVTQPADNQIRWTVVSGAHALISFIATIEPDGENATKVAVSAEPAPGKEDTEIGRRMNSNPAIVKLYQSAMTEQIDAKLEGRSFNMSAIQAQMMAATISSMPQIQADLAKAAHDSAEDERRMRSEQADAEFEREQRARIEGVVTQ